MNEVNQQLPDPLMMPGVKSDSSGGADNNLNNSEVTQKITSNSFPLPSSQNNSSTSLPTPHSSQNLQLTSPVTTQATNTQIQQSTLQQQSLISNTPAIADDIDLIEKVWVEKAKEIVDKTHDNPYLQNKAISEIKADYIKKRYNKDISKSD